MAYGQDAEFALHIATQEYTVQGTDYTTVGWVTETLEALDLAYNLRAVVEIADQGNVPYEQFIELSRIFRHVEDYSVTTMNLLLRRYIGIEGHAQLRSIEITKSFDVKIGGLHKVIDSLARVFDPIERRKRRNEVENEKDLGDLHVVREKIAVARAAVELAKEIDGNQNYVNIAADVLGHTRQTELTQAIAIESERVIGTILANNEVTVTERPESA